MGKKQFGVCFFRLLFLVINAVVLLYLLTCNQLSFFPPDVCS